MLHALEDKLYIFHIFTRICKAADYAYAKYLYVAYMCTYNHVCFRTSKICYSKK